MHFNDFIHSQLSDHPHYLLIGNPVGHSVSPLMHNLALDFHHMDATYIPISLQMSDLSKLAAYFNKSTFLGANITIPYKEALIPFMDELSSHAKEIRAINTIIKKENTLIGENTDVHGFKVPLHEIEDLESSRAIIFGTGGATKAIIFALNDFGFDEVCLVSRNPHRLKKYSNQIICSYDNWHHYSDDTSLFINATPLGMTPHKNRSPIFDHQIEHLRDKLCYDIIYNPRETKFLKQAKQAGGIPIGGLDMLIHQGNESFYKWTGKTFPLRLVKNKLHEYFSS